MSIFRPFHLPALRKGSAAWRSVALALLLTPFGAWAQTAGATPELQDWRAANEAVAQFKRGHLTGLVDQGAALAEYQACAWL